MNDALFKLKEHNLQQKEKEEITIKLSAVENYKYFDYNRCNKNPCCK